MKSSKTSFLRNCISGWNVRSLFVYLCSSKDKRRLYKLNHKTL